MAIMTETHYTVKVHHCFTVSFMNFTRHSMFHQRMDEVKDWCSENLPKDEYIIEDTDLGITVCIKTKELAMAYKLRWA